eukprot:9496818-Pyramimonas_sp.AAC.2
MALVPHILPCISCEVSPIATTRVMNWTSQGRAILCPRRRAFNNDTSGGRVFMISCVYSVQNSRKLGQYELIVFVVVSQSSTFLNFVYC